MALAETAVAPRLTTITLPADDLQMIELALDYRIGACIAQDRIDLAERYLTILNQIERHFAPCGQTTSLGSYVG